MRRRDFLFSCARCALAAPLASLAPAALLALHPADALAGQGPQPGLPGVKRSPYFEPLPGNAVRCTLCPRGCEVEEGERGWCRVRENRDGAYYSLVYGNPCSVAVDPIEKKPLFHVLPGTLSFSLATAGCNFDCKFCQNWEISQARPDETMNYPLPPETVAELALRHGCASVASTYVEPTIFMEYMQDMGRAVRPRGLLKVMHSNGYVAEKPLNDLCTVLDAACIDLKGFTREYYSSMTEGELQPVLDTLVRLKARGVHTELVTLIVPGRNDDMGVIRDMCVWVRDLLGPDTPHHFSRFYPKYKLPGLPPTPVATLEQARRTAMEAGLRFVYIGNVPGHPAENTWCPDCGAELISRLGYRTTVKGLKHGACAKCGREIPGIWARP